MKLATVLLGGASSPVAAEVRGDTLHCYPAGTSVLDLLGADGAVPPAPGEGLPIGDATLLAPIPDARVFYGVGLNYAAHAAEQGLEPPAQPIIFTMQPGSGAAPGADIVCPEVVKRLDYEGELAVIIGARGTIAGYAVADDVSARDLQKRERQWTRAKGFDGACPFGPWITTADAVPDPCALQLKTWVNDELRQDSSTADMIFTPQQIVDFLSETCTLHPGDVILSGTPSGVGMSMEPPQFLQSGDTVRIEIESLGSITHAVA